MTISVGVPVTGNFTRNGEFAVSSMSTASQTNCPACRASEPSVNTNARMSRHECHHIAKAAGTSTVNTLRSRIKILPSQIVVMTELPEAAYTMADSTE